MKEVLQLYSLRHFLKTEEMIKETLKKVKDMGFDYILLSGIGKFSDDKINFIDQCTKELDLKIIGTHIDYNQLKEEFEQTVKYHKQLGCSYVGISAIPDGFDRRSLNDYQAFIFQANQMANRLKEHDLKLVYHHHAFEFAKIDEFLPMDVIMQNMISENLSVEPDLFWIQFSGLNPLDFIETYKHKIELIQIKDMKVKLSNKWVTTAQCAPIGEGNMDYKKIISVINRLDFPYLIIEQDEFFDQDPFIEIATSLKHVKAYKSNVSLNENKQL
ncbi:MAG: sugar phosphate isomerase/epimerase family protein [Acholeplasmataceae bacterium]